MILCKSWQSVLSAEEIKSIVKNCELDSSSLCGMVYITISDKTGQLLQQIYLILLLLQFPSTNKSYNHIVFYPHSILAFHWQVENTYITHHFAKKGDFESCNFLLKFLYQTNKILTSKLKKFKYKFKYI